MTSLSKIGLTPSQSENCIRIAWSTKTYIETNFHKPVHLEDLSRHTGVGIRWLQRCFKKHFDITITDFLKTVRLDAAHRALTAADSREVSVAQVALSNGFTHAGRFSVTYRKRFGESPNETLAAPSAHIADGHFRQTVIDLPLAESSFHRSTGATFRSELSKMLT